MPKALHWPSWIAADGTLSVDGTGVTRKGDLANAYFFPAQPGVINQDYDQPLKISHGRVVLGLKPRLSFLCGAADERPACAHDEVDGSQSAAMISATPGAPPPVAPSGSRLAMLFAMMTSLGFVSLLGGALLGGLILNLMPLRFSGARHEGRAPRADPGCQCGGCAAKRPRLWRRRGGEFRGARRLAAGTERGRRPSPAGVSSSSLHSSCWR